MLQKTVTQEKKKCARKIFHSQANEYLKTIPSSVSINQSIQVHIHLTFSLHPSLSRSLSLSLHYKSLAILSSSFFSFLSLSIHRLCTLSVFLWHRQSEKGERKKQIVSIAYLYLYGVMQNWLPKTVTQEIIHSTTESEPGIRCFRINEHFYQQLSSLLLLASETVLVLTTANIFKRKTKYKYGRLEKVVS